MRRRRRSRQQSKSGGCDMNMNLKARRNGAVTSCWLSNANTVLLSDDARGSHGSARRIFGDGPIKCTVIDARRQGCGNR